MSKVFVKSLLLTMLTVIVLTACGTTAPTTTLASAYPNTASSEPTTAPVTETAVATTAAPASGSISFATDILPIFESRCFNCHGGDKTEKGLDLKAYASMMLGSERGVVIVAGDAGTSKLFMAVAAGKMPKKGPKLTPQQIELIMNWINSGALNN